MNSFRDSWLIFSRLSGAQKFVLLRIFIVINAAAYVLATQHDFNSDWVYIGTLVVTYALESAFMLWLGFKRGIGFHRTVLGSNEQPLMQKSAGSAWYAAIIGFSVVLTVVTGLIVTSIDDGSGLAPLRATAFLFVEATVMAFALLQGLRLGWNAITVASKPVPMEAKVSDLQAGVLPRPHTPVQPLESQVSINKRAVDVKRGRIALGCISVICAGLAIYFHFVAHEMGKPDPENDAAIQAAVQGLGDGTSPAVGVDPTAKQDALPPNDPRIDDTLAKAAQIATESGVAQDSGTFPFPVAAGTRSPDGYPIYLLECNVEANTCFGGEGQAYGTIAKTADQLTPIRNSDAMRYKCIQRVCVDTAGNYVGAISSVMQTYWEAHHAP